MSTTFPPLEVDRSWKEACEPLNEISDKVFFSGRLNVIKLFLASRSRVWICYRNGAYLLCKVAS